MFPIQWSVYETTRHGCDYGDGMWGVVVEKRALRIQSRGWRKRKDAKQIRRAIYAALSDLAEYAFTERCMYEEQYPGSDLWYEAQKERDSPVEAIEAGEVYWFGVPACSCEF